MTVWVLWKDERVLVFDARVKAYEPEDVLAGTTIEPTSSASQAEFMAGYRPESAQWRFIDAPSRGRLPPVDRGNLAHPGTAPESTVAHRRRERIIVDSGCGDTIISNGYAQAAVCPSATRREPTLKTFPWSGRHFALYYQGEGTHRGAE